MLRVSIASREPSQHNVKDLLQGSASLVSRRLDHDASNPMKINRLSSRLGHAADAMDTLSLARRIDRHAVRDSPPTRAARTLIAELLRAGGLRDRAAEIRRGRQPLGAPRPRRARARVRRATPTSCRRARASSGSGSVRRRRCRRRQLIGRGAADMKGSLAAMINACRAVRRTLSATTAARSGC